MNGNPSDNGTVGTSKTPAADLHPIRFKTVAITSLIGGFLVIPVHEFGHVVCDWITGHPAGMSYARDYLLTDGPRPFLGVLGGPLFPLIFSAVAVAFIYRGSHLSVAYPIAILGTLDRLLLYLSGSVPSDELTLARSAGWPDSSFRSLFLAAEMILLLLVLVSLIRYRVGAKRAILVFCLPVVFFVTGAVVGVFVVDRYLFPEQHRKEFGASQARPQLMQFRVASGGVYPFPVTNAAILSSASGDTGPSKASRPPSAVDL